MSAIDQLGKGGAAALGLAREAIDAASPTLKQWLKTGAALGAARTGARVARGVVRRNPGLALAAAAVGAGYLAYTAYRKHAAAAPAHAASAGPIDSTATVVETRKRTSAPRRKTAAATSSPAEGAATPAPKRARKRPATPS